LRMNCLINADKGANWGDACI